MRYYIFAACMAMCSCSQIDFIENEQQLTFEVAGDFANPQFTRAGMMADGVEMTDLWIVDYKDGEIKQQVHQTNGDANWGSPTLSLTLGHHHVMFLASRGVEPNYDDGVVTWVKPLDTFYLDYEVEVVKSTSGNRTVTLNRVATKLQLVVQDAIAEGTTSIVFTPSTWYNGFDMLNGIPVEVQDYSTTFSIPSTMIGRTGLTLSMWCPSASEEWKTDINMTSYAGTSVNAEVNITNAPLMANRATIYRGNMYSEQSQSSISFNDEWMANYEGVY